MCRFRINLIIFFGILISLLNFVEARECPCSSINNCKRIHHNRQEIFGSILKSKFDVWKNFNWTKLTTISMIDFYDDELMCLAHKNHVRVLTQEKISLYSLNNESYVSDWIEQRIKFSEYNFLDGINLFVDDPLEKSSPLKAQLTKFVKLVTEKFHKNINDSIVVFNVPWSPINEKKMAVDGKNYDYTAISEIVDQFLVMDYEQLSQTFDGECLAGASSNYYYAIGGLLAYQNIDVDLKKLILGVPLYADNYKCINYKQNYNCIIEPYNYRNSKCSSYSAEKIPLNKLDKFMENQQYILSFDEHSTTTFYVYLVSNNSNFGTIQQVWYETDYSLWKKYLLVSQMNLKGVGLFSLNWMDSGMWSYLPDYK